MSTPDSPTQEQAMRVSGPYVGGPDTAGSSASEWDLSSYIGRYVKFKLDPEGDYALVGMRSATGGTLSTTDNTAPVVNEGVVKYGPGDEGEYLVRSQAPFLVFQRANSTDVKMYIWIAD